MRWTDRAPIAVRRVLVPGNASNRGLRVGLGLLAFIASAATTADLLRVFPRSVDLEIPLRAATRWLAGGQAYVPSSFLVGSGYDLPYLYPPYALPLFAPLTFLPRDLLHLAWFVAGLALAWTACRRLGIPRRWIPLVLVWPPFATGLLAGNIQVATFAAFVLLMEVVDGPAGPAGPAVEREVDRNGDRRARSILARGLLGAATVFLKVSQTHGVIHLLRRDWRAAFVAAGAVGLLVVASLPFTGISIWGDWLQQLRRASDPAWGAIGTTLARILPDPLPTLIVVACLAGALLVSRRGGAAWIGVLLVLGSPSLHTYYLLFLMPAMLRLRWEIGLVAALVIGFQVVPGWWAAITIVSGCLALSVRFPRLLEPARTSASSAGGRAG